MKQFTQSALAALCATLASVACVAQDGVVVPVEDEPFSYPATLMNARSTYTVSPATPVVLGETVVVLESSRLNDVAAIARAPVYTEGEDKKARHWVCVAAENKGKPLRLWFIASGQDTVTEVQMSPGTFKNPANCGKINDHFEPVYLSRIASGMNIREVAQDIGPASYKDDAGWNFWVSRRTYTYFENRFTEYVWVGALSGADGTISEVFTTQITR
ncbi:MAG: hypothetical protein Q4E62_06855 [Sutterellaceae bacterium]|nr:hypothetical protein [Sutterellaceae bacterium]